MLEVIVPVKVKRIEEINWIFETDNKDEANDLVTYIQDKGLIELNPKYEEVVRVIEEDLLEAYEDEVEIIEKKEKKKEKLINEIKEYIFSLYKIVDVFYNLGSDDNAEYFGEEIKNLEKLVKELEKGM